MLNFVAASLLVPICFKEGPVQSLVAQLSQALQANCVAEIFDGDQVFGAFKAPSDIPSLRAVLLKKTGYRLSFSGKTIILTTGFVWPSVFSFRGEKAPPRGVQPSPIGIDTHYSALERLDKKRLLRGDLQTIDTKPGECFTLADLHRASALTTRWDSEWPFIRVPLATSVRDLDGKSLLRAIAAAEGARLKEGPDGIHLQFSGAEYKRRFVHSAEDSVLLNHMHDAEDSSGVPLIISSRLSFRKKTIQLLSDDFLERAFREGAGFGGKIDFTPETAKIKSACSQFAADLLARMSLDIQNGTVSHQDFKHVDPDTGVSYFFFHAPSEFYIAIKEKDANLMLFWG